MVDVDRRMNASSGCRSDRLRPLMIHLEESNHRLPSTVLRSTLWPWHPQRSRPRRQPRLDPDLLAWSFRKISRGFGGFGCNSFSPSLVIFVSANWMYDIVSVYRIGLELTINEEENDVCPKPLSKNEWQRRRRDAGIQESMKARSPAPDWLDRVIGSMKDEPAFDEVLAYGRAIRQADRPADDQAP